MAQPLYKNGPVRLCYIGRQHSVTSRLCSAGENAASIAGD